jgi:hypothetical protein
MERMAGARVASLNHAKPQIVAHNVYEEGLRPSRTSLA